MGPSSEGFTRYEAGTSPDDYISFSTPSTRSSYYQSAIGPLRACSRAISLRRKDIFDDGSLRNELFFMTLWVIGFRRPF